MHAGRYKLRLADFSLSVKGYLPCELEPTVFDPARDMPPDMHPAPDSLYDARAEVWWLQIG